MVLKNRKFTVLVLVILSIVIFIVGFDLINRYYYNPKKVFKQKFGFDLPESAEFLNHRCHLYGSVLLGHRSFFAKISLKEEDVELIKEQLLSFYEPVYEDASHDSFRIQNRSIVSWWDINEDDVVIGYHIMKADNREIKIGIFYEHWSATSVNVDSFITKDEQGEYFLYVAYY